jgi:hypothetical protein
MKALLIIIFSVLIIGAISCKRSHEKRNLMNIKVEADSIAAVRIDSEINIINRQCSERMVTEVSHLADSIAKSNISAR